MSTAYREAFIYVQNSFAGTLEETDSGYRFTYNAAYLQSGNVPAVSLTLPVRREPHESQTLFSFFDGLIPEGWLYEIAIRNWKIDRNDRFGALLTVNVIFQKLLQKRMQVLHP